MNTNSIEYLVDVKLFNKIVNLFEFYGNPKPWLIKVDSDYGKWKDLRVCDLAKMINESESMEELRSIALVMWLYDFDSSVMVSRMLRMMDEGDSIDALFCAAVIESPRCTDEVRELLRRNFSECKQNGLLEYVIGLDALNGEMDDFTCEYLAGLCSALVRENGVGVRDGFTVLSRLALFYDEKGENTSELCKQLFSLWTTVPKRGGKAVGLCNYYGIPYRDCLLFSVMMQQFSHAKSIRSSDKKWRKLVTEFVDAELTWYEEWEDIDKRIILSVLEYYSCSKSGIRVANSENYYWLIANTGVGDTILLNLVSKGWKERFMALDPSVKNCVLRNSLSASSDSAVEVVWHSDESIVREAFSEFSNHSVDVFTRLVKLGLFSEVSFDNDEILYWAEYFSAWRSKKSFEFMQALITKFGSKSEYVWRVVKKLTIVDFDFLSEDENDYLFMVVNEYVFNFAPNKYKNFVQINVDHSSIAKDIWDEAMGGDEND